MFSTFVFRHRSGSYPKHFAGIDFCLPLGVIVSIARSSQSALVVVAKVWAISCFVSGAQPTIVSVESRPPQASGRSEEDHNWSLDE